MVRVDQYIYANSLDGAFTNWDDDKLVLHNETIQSLSTANLMAIFTPERAQSFQPIRDLSYAVDFALWGEAAFWLPCGQYPAARCWQLFSILAPAHRPGADSARRAPLLAR